MNKKFIIKTIILSITLLLNITSYNSILAMENEPPLQSQNLMDNPQIAIDQELGGKESLFGIYRDNISGRLAQSYPSIFQSTNEEIKNTIFSFIVNEFKEQFTPDRLKNYYRLDLNQNPIDYDFFIKIIKSIINGIICNITNLERIDAYASNFNIQEFNYDSNDPLILTLKSMVGKCVKIQINKNILNRQAENIEITLLENRSEDNDSNVYIFQIRDDWYVPFIASQIEKLNYTLRINNFKINDIDSFNFEDFSIPSTSKGIHVEEEKQTKDASTQTENSEESSSSGLFKKLIPGAIIGGLGTATAIAAHQFITRKNDEQNAQPTVKIDASTQNTEAPETSTLIGAPTTTETSAIQTNTPEIETPAKHFNITNPGLLKRLFLSKYITTGVPTIASYIWFATNNVNPVVFDPVLMGATTLVSYTGDRAIRSVVNFVKKYLKKSPKEIRENFNR
ncbi:MAG: hypothetical protein WC436_01550 [Candidatus Babeliales bacterium]